MLSFAPLTFLLFVISPWALYFTGWYDASLQSDFVHEMMHVHLVLVGSLFFWPLVGSDPVPGRVAYPFRLLLIVLTLPFHAFLGVTIMGQEELIAGEWYRSLPAEAGLTWLPDPAADQHLAGGILWGSGDLVGLVFLGGAVHPVGALVDAGGRAGGPPPRPPRAVQRRLTRGWSSDCGWSSLSKPLPVASAT